MVKTESEIIETIKEALKQAENLQLQGGRAIEYEATLHAFRGCWSILQTHSDYNSRHWYVDYCVRCRQSMAQIYSIQSNFAEAESSVQEAIYIIIQGQENNFGQNFSSSRAENMQCQLLTLVSIAISDVCLNSANTHGIEKALSLLTWYLSLLRTNTSFGSSTSSISSALGSFVFNVTASCMAENPDPVIASFCIPAIPALHNHFIKSQEFYLHKLASIISSVYMSMGQYAAAVHVYSHALDHAEPYYIGNGASSSSEQEKTVVLDMRRGYVDCVLRCYEALQSNAHMYRVWLDKVLSNMRQIGCFAPQDKEMWGDLLVLSGGLDSQVLGFCVYVAWHHAHGLGANTQVTRMNAKLKKLVDKVELMRHVYHVATIGLAGVDIDAPYMPFLLRSGIVQHTNGLVTLIRARCETILKMNRIEFREPIPSRNYPVEPAASALLISPLVGPMDALMMECDLLDREKKSFNSILEFLRITCILPAASSYEYITNILKRLAAISISMLADIVCRDESSIDVVFDRPHVLHRSIILNALTNFQQGPDGQVVVEKLENKETVRLQEYFSKQHLDETEAQQLLSLYTAILNAPMLSYCAYKITVEIHSCWRVQSLDHVLLSIAQHIDCVSTDSDIMLTFQQEDSLWRHLLETSWVRFVSQHIAQQGTTVPDSIASSQGADDSCQRGLLYLCVNLVRSKYQAAYDGEQQAADWLKLTAASYASGNSHDRAFSLVAKSYWMCLSVVGDSDVRDLHRAAQLGIEVFPSLMAILQSLSDSTNVYGALAWVIGLCYQYGLGTAGNKHQAVHLYQQSASFGLVEAQYQLGMCYQQGQGVIADYTVAYDWLTKAGEQGHVEAQFKVGYGYAQGTHLPQDYSKAVFWLSKAAERNHIEAQTNLAYCYANGFGTQIESARAFDLYIRAADKGFVNAQINVAYCYKIGRSVDQDFTKAAEWYGKAAIQGNMDAQFELSILLLNGTGVTQNRREASVWLRKAAAQNHLTAISKLAELDKVASDYI